MEIKWVGKTVARRDSLVWRGVSVNTSRCRFPHFFLFLFFLGTDQVKKETEASMKTRAREGREGRDGRDESNRSSSTRREYRRAIGGESAGAAPFTLLGGGLECPLPPLGPV